MTAASTPPTLPSKSKNLKKIYVIGPQASGKTTYLLALALLNFKSKNYFHVKGTVKVRPDPGKTTEFQQEGLNKWRSQAPLEPTALGSGFNDSKEYKFLIEIKKQFSSLNIIFNARDYGGEFFKDLRKYSSPNPVLKSYLDGCLNNESSGCILMLPDFISEQTNVDAYYVEVMDRFISEANSRNLMNKLRLAVVMSKCERGELWPSRWEPERDLFKVHLSDTTNYLRVRSGLLKENMSFFALSSFGVLDKTNPCPNRWIIPGKDAAVLRDTDNWIPYGLINPLYWIATGKIWKDPSF